MEEGGQSEPVARLNSAMEPLGRRLRRFRFVGRRRRDGVLPSHSTPSEPLDDSVSCCYKDFKIFALNEPLFRFGRRHDAVLRVWFSMGVGFGLASLLLVSSGLLLQLIPNGVADRLAAVLFGFSASPSISGFVHVFLSTVLSVSVHEFGHALAAASILMASDLGTSEGVNVEYIAIFIAAVFPGALVAFNHDVLQSLPRYSVLRMYCAGIWHNAVLCAACVLALFLLPLILLPFYSHGESPMVLDVPSTSPVFGYLSAGDVILSLDGVRIHNPKEWMGMASLLEKHTFQGTNSSLYPRSSEEMRGGIGYCVPKSVIEESNGFKLESQVVCPEGLTAFVAGQCSGYGGPHKNDSNISEPEKRESVVCLNPKAIVKLNKCGGGSVTSTDDGRSTCTCSQVESCLSPVQLPGLTWTEIRYLTSVSPECIKTIRDRLADSIASNFTEYNCTGTFVFVGDVMAMAHSVQLTSYRPRWGFYGLARLPGTLEWSLTCTFHVSLTLILLNSLPVYYLDGESILEVVLCYFSWLSPRTRKRALRISLLGGTFISLLAVLRAALIGLR